MNESIKETLFGVLANTVSGLLVVLISLLVIRGCEIDADYYRRLSLDSQNAQAIALSQCYLKTVTLFPEFREILHVFKETPQKCSAEKIVKLSSQLDKQLGKLKFSIKSMSMDSAKNEIILKPIQNLSGLLVAFAEQKKDIEEGTFARLSGGIFDTNNIFSNKYDDVVRALDCVVATYPIFYKKN